MTQRKTAPLLDDDTVPYCIKCDYINDTDQPCYNCGEVEVERREPELL